MSYRRKGRDEPFDPATALVLERLWRDHFEPLVARLVWMTSDRHAAEDLVQRALIKVGKELDSGGVRNPAGLLRVAAERLAINHLRDRKNEKSLEVAQEQLQRFNRSTRLTRSERREFKRRAEWLSVASAEDEYCAVGERRRAFVEAMARLSTAQLQAFGQVEFRGLTENEAAEESGRSRSTINKNLERARSALRADYVFADAC